MPTRLCATPGCPNPATHRGRCPTHTRTRDKTTHPNKQTYNTRRWHLLRRRVLTHQPICNHPDCNMLATDVDHITPISQGGLPWTLTNLQALCHHHHSIKTRAEQKAS